VPSDPFNPGFGTRLLDFLFSLPSPVRPLIPEDPRKKNEDTENRLLRELRK
jgi:hypothetical protein